ncbi:MAG: hypothetical protein K2Q12_05725 [Rickettsiales bacterium]|nr:hypothetical protein [Rickettsiales bacterium]
MGLALRLFITALALVSISLLALWLRDHPGMVRLDWLGYRIETPLAIIAGAFLIGAMTLSLALYGLIRLSYFPLRYRMRKKEVRFRESLDHLTYAMTSLAVADNTSALRYARLAQKELGEHPLLELIRAHVARRTDDSQTTEQQLSKMLAFPATRMLAASALSHLAQQQLRQDDALKFALIAHEMQPAHRPNIAALLQLYLGTHSWQEALLLLEKSRRLSHLTKKEAAHLEALLAWQQASSLHGQGNDPASAVLIEQAFKKEPRLTAAAERYITHLMAKGQIRRAKAALERAWRFVPHPALTKLFFDLHAMDSSAKRRSAAVHLCTSQQTHLESYVLQARVAMMDKQWSQAREWLNGALTLATQTRLYRIYAEIERANGNSLEAQQLLDKAMNAQADSQWICNACGHVHIEWSVFCEQCHAFDSVQWRSAAPLLASAPHGESFTIPYDITLAD